VVYNAWLCNLTQKVPAALMICFTSDMSP